MKKHMQQKRVSFKSDQLSFSTNTEKAAFVTEMQPEPVTIRQKSVSKSRSRSRSGSAGKKSKKKPTTKPKSSLVKGGPLTRPGGKPWTGTTERKQAAKPLKEWNNSITQSQKYFDPSIDPKELRKQSKITAATKPEVVSKGKEFVV